uniref:Uncharacterized protein n=1 Tax=Taeniopygia guttata TaxID=59729 RepID=A0A674GN85_TAEGU
MQCSALRKNGFVVLKGRPCKIVEMSTSKTGKHRPRQGAPGGHRHLHGEEVRGHLSLHPQHGRAQHQTERLPADRDPGRVPVAAPGQWGGAGGSAAAGGGAGPGDRAEVRLRRGDTGAYWFILVSTGYTSYTGVYWLYWLYWFVLGELGREIEQKYDCGEEILITVLSAMTEEAAVAIKAMAK